MVSRSPVDDTLVKPCGDDPQPGLAMQAIGADQGEAVLEEAVAASREALGTRFLAAYALGSLAHGGFSPLVSDVDLGLIPADPVTATDEETLKTVAGTIKALAGP
jgi:hypothetical protein